MQFWIYFACLAFALTFSSALASESDDNGEQNEEKWRIPAESLIRIRTLAKVNAEYYDGSEEALEEIKEKAPSFSSSDSFDDEEITPTDRKNQERSFGGMVLNIGQGGSSPLVPGNVFGSKYVSHIIQDTCKPPGFPYVCERQNWIDTTLKCPVDIPYCQRIRCGTGRPEFDQDFAKCVKQPGCCFDWTLWNYRRHYGQTVLPRVPVCHQAVRNPVFHSVARRYQEKYRSWNPLLTTCLINTYENRIIENEKECDTLEIFGIFGFRPKQAGWRRITARECGLIGGCWIPTKGCFYPPRMSHLQLRSSNDFPTHRPWSPFDIYGQPQCLPMDPKAKSEDFLTSYHQCLASGCSVDPAVTPDIILYHLNEISKSLPEHLVSSFKYEIMLGKVRPDNFRFQLDHFLRFAKSRPPSNNYGHQNQKPHLPPEVVPFLKRFPGPASPYQSPNTNPLQLLAAITSGVSHIPNPYFAPNPNAFMSSQFLPRNGQQAPPRHYMYRPPYGAGSHYETKPGQINLFPMPCPFQLVRIPNFPPLEGRLDDCCDRNLCYVSRDTVRHQYSGAATYWGPWGLWSRCNSPCGNAVQKRYRICVGPSPEKCGGPRQDQRSCTNLPPCARERMTKWSQWSQCDRDCGGWRVRNRKCQDRGCQGPTRERKPCPKKCPSTTTNSP